MNKDEFNKYLDITLKEIENQKKETEVSKDITALSHEMDEYTIDDVINTIAQMSPGDENLARIVVEEMETKRRPGPLLASIQDKITLHERVKDAKTKLGGKYDAINYHNYQSDIYSLRYQGVIDEDDTQRFFEKLDHLGMLITGNISEEYISKGTITADLKPWLLYGAATEFFITSAAAYLLGASELIMVAGLTGLIPSHLIGTYFGNKRINRIKKSNLEKEKELIKEFEGRFAQEILDIEHLTRKFLERIESENISIQNPAWEEEIIESISQLKKYFRDVIKYLPDLKQRYIELKNTEMGLPVQEMKMPLLIAKSIKGRYE